MKVEINIPSAFEKHYNSDRFEDSLKRLIADAGEVAGKYEVETAEMLIKAFKESKQV